MELRILLPDTLAGWRYLIRHPKYFIVGRYGRKQFIRQRDIMLAAIRQRNDIEMKYSKVKAQLIEVRKELSDLKRNKSKESK